MKVKIHYRCDSEETFTTDDTILFANSWEDVFQEIKTIEASDTVISIERLDID